MIDSVNPSAAVQRIALAVEYDGSGFSGWQRQQSPELITVQSALESALSQVADQTISTVCAGRTDAGVHATSQVLHFDCAIDRGNKAWTRGVNSLLPDNVRVIWSKQVDSEFHARFSATARRYVYLIQSGDFASAIYAKKLTHVRGALDVAVMDRAAQHLLGEQDFSSFRAAGCQSKTASRNVFEAGFSRHSGLLVFDIRANAFLQHMVRNIVGALLEVGKSKRDSGWIKELLAAQDRTLAGVAAPPDGLYLAQVDYPASFGLPSSSRMPLILGDYGKA